MVARDDQVRDPEVLADLLLMRRGQAFWARQLAGVADGEFDGPTLIPRWTRRRLIAHVGLNARSVAHLIEGVRSGLVEPTLPTASAADVGLASTLPAEALRHLCSHAAVHLNVEWRDLPDAAWRIEVEAADGARVTARELLWKRAREVWIHAVDLDNGARFADLPADLLDRMLTELSHVWQRRTDDQVVLDVVDREPGRPEAVRTERGDGDPIVVRGTAAELVGWGLGRDRHGIVTTTGMPRPDPPLSTGMEPR